MGTDDRPLFIYKQNFCVAAAVPRKLSYFDFVLLHLFYCRKVCQGNKAPVIMAVNEESNLYPISLFLKKFFKKNAQATPSRF